jgi:hypothetical protein
MKIDLFFVILCVIGLPISIIIWCYLYDLLLKNSKHPNELKSDNSPKFRLYGFCICGKYHFKAYSQSNDYNYRYLKRYNKPIVCPKCGRDLFDYDLCGIYSAKKTDHDLFEFAPDLYDEDFRDKVFKKLYEKGELVDVKKYIEAESISHSWDISSWNYWQKQQEKLISEVLGE